MKQALDIKSECPAINVFKEKMLWANGDVYQSTEPEPALEESEAELEEELDASLLLGVSL